MKLLAIGDMHLGRIPSGLPSDIDLSRFKPSKTWDRIVKKAIEEKVDIIVMLGDVIESENDFYEAYPILKTGISKLINNNIQVIAIAGNHDFKVLPKLAEDIEQFKVLGLNNKWEKFTLDLHAITFHGYSFSKKKILESPLKDIIFERGEGFNIGLLHCDRNKISSNYAPVTAEQLNTNMDLWLLGHVHKPDKLSTENPSGYLGSVTSLNYTETGDLGPWLYVIKNKKIESVSQWVLSPIRREIIELDLSGIEDENDGIRKLNTKLEVLENHLKAKEYPPDIVKLHLRLSGRTGLGSKVQELLLENKAKVFFDHNETRYSIQDCICLTKPEICLKQLSQKTDLQGMLAKKLLSLEEGEEIPILIKTRERMNKTVQQMQLSDNKLEQSHITESLLHAGYRLLEALIQQSEEMIE